MDPGAGTPWSRPETVASFTQSQPNAELIRFAEQERAQLTSAGQLLDLGCGAGRNAVPLALQGWTVFGVDFSRPMLLAAAARIEQTGVADRCRLALASMDRLPVRDSWADFGVAHGIWNLARSGAEFRRAVREAARAAKPRAFLFVFTFSRNTLSEGARPVAGESFVFTEFSGEPQCFVTEQQLVSELRDGGFEPDSSAPLRELNRRSPGMVRSGGPPVIYEGGFRRGNS